VTDVITCQLLSLTRFFFWYPDDDDVVVAVVSLFTQADAYPGIAIMR
jgi:hypothetical protein